MEADDEILLLLGEAAPLEVRPQVVDPSQPAALAAPLQTYIHKKHSLINYIDHSERQQQEIIYIKQIHSALYIPASFGTELQQPTPYRMM